MTTTASTVTVFGKGNMGSAIAEIFRDAGSEVQVLDSSAGADTTVTGEIVVLAVPYQALSGIAGTFGATSVRISEAWQRGDVAALSA